jgi:hypothetical protein
MSVDKVTLGFGGALVGLGLGAYAYGALTRTEAGGPSKTALIPAGYGAAFVGLGLLAGAVGARRAVLTGAAGLAGVGAVGLTSMVASKLRKGGPVNTRAVAVQATTAALSAAYAGFSASRLRDGRV